MLINTIANHLRQRNGERLTISQLEAELRECEAIKSKSDNMRLHIKTIKASIYLMKKNRLQ